MEENRPVFSGEVHIDGTRIIYAGDSARDAVSSTADETGGSTGDGAVGSAGDKSGDAGARPWDREIDCQGNLLMPGFKNAHTHSGMTLLRSYADDLPLSDWLNNQVFPVEAQMTAEDIYHLTRLAVLEYLTSGITAIFDMYLTPESIAQACSDMGMRCVQVGAANDFGQTTETVAKMYHRLNQKDSLNSYILGFHAEYTCSEELLLRVAELSHRYQAPVFTHLAETADEVQGCRERHNGMTPAVYLDSLGLFDYGGGGFHCVHMSEADMEVFRKRGLYAVTNPASNLKLASGIAPVAEFLERGIPVAIGTDGPASNNCLDMFREMFLVTGLAKVRENNAAAVDATEVLKMACVNGAAAMGLTDAVSLVPGNLADMIMIDLRQPNMRPLNNIAKNIVYSGSKLNVTMTMINGKILYEKGDFYSGPEVSSIYAKAGDIIQRLKA